MEPLIYRSLRGEIRSIVEPLGVKKKTDRERNAEPSRGRVTGVSSQSSEGWRNGVGVADEPGFFQLIGTHLCATHRNAGPLRIG